MCEPILMVWIILGALSGVLVIGAVVADWLEQRPWFRSWHHHRTFKPMATKWEDIK